MEPPLSETHRLHSLNSYEILDTAPEEAFDRLTRLAADLFDAPVALISLIDADRQWVKSGVGTDQSEWPRAIAFCAHAIGLEAEAVMIVEDATLDPRFKDHPQVTGGPRIRFYAAAVLTSPSGHNLGTLCVMDDRTRPRLTGAEVERLRALAHIAVDELELGRVRRRAAQAQQTLERLAGMAGEEPPPADEASAEGFRRAG